MRTQLFQTILITSALLLGSAAQAEISQFELEVHNAQKVCADLRCELSPVKLVSVDSPSHELPRALLRRLNSLASEIANNIWPDTIFEGGVVSAEDNINLESVELVMNSAGHIGYRITYSAVAYNMDQCVDYNNVRTCQVGKIYESAYVSEDFSVNFTDYADLAHFIEN